MKLRDVIFGLFALALAACAMTPAAAQGINCTPCMKLLNKHAPPPPVPAPAPTTPAPTTPFTGLAAAVKACTSACTINLTPGTYGPLSLVNLNPTSLVAVNLKGSTFPYVGLRADSNLTLVSGKVDCSLPGANQYGFGWTVDTTTGVTLSGPTADKCQKAGFVLTRSKNVSLLNWIVTAPGCDGVDASGNSGFIISGGSYTGYAPSPTTGCHADGVQFWNMTGFPAQNGQIINNKIISTAAPDPGNTAGALGVQGITDFGMTAGNNITVTGNNIQVHGSWCLALNNITGLVFQNNVCTDLLPEPWKTRWETTGSTGTIGPNILDGVSM